VIVKALAQFWAAIVGGWIRRRVTARWRRDLRDRCDQRELRLEDANTPTLLMSLHSLVYRAFRAGPTMACHEVHELLDMYADALIARQRCISLLRSVSLSVLYVRLKRAHMAGRTLSGEILQRRIALWHSVNVHRANLDEATADLHALVRLHCEHALLRSAGGLLPQSAPQARERVWLREVFLESDGQRVRAMDGVNESADGDHPWAPEDRHRLEAPRYLPAIDHR
jgi:hypothetical protein